MITEEEALAEILGRVHSLPARTVPLAEGLEQFAACDIFARHALPLFDNSAMDGYAVAIGSNKMGESLRVVGEQPAGLDLQLRVRSGKAVRIFTGAPLPDGTDAVVMQEGVRRDGDEIWINEEVKQGDFIRRRGCDLSEGQKILEAGECIQPQLLALLAAQGFADIEVGGSPAVAVITTGDELVRPGASLKAGQIYESNSVLLDALLQKSGAAAATIKHCPDNLDAIHAAMKSGVQGDVLVVVGGVSVGARDLVKEGLKSIGAQTDLWRVSVKPGKPFLFGRAGKCAIFGLPGNPVSAFVTFLLFVRPAILKMRGSRKLSLPKQAVRLKEEVKNPGDRPHYLRGRAAEGIFSVVGRQESHALFGLSQANALLRVPPGKTFRSGETVEILRFD